MKFTDLGVLPEIEQALKHLSIEEPTDIQEKSIPPILKGKDLVGMSRTGSGKTAAFGIPLVQKIRSGEGIQALVTAPTRELVDQIAKELIKFSKNLNVSIATVFGGVAIGPQIDAMERADVVVGTPGRLLDHLDRGTMDLSRLNLFVFDEADKMVDMGFIEDIEAILSFTPKNKQMLLFGATLSQEIKGIKERHMHDSVTAKAVSHVKEDMLEQYYYNVKPHEKFSLLVHLLKKEKIDRAIIFCSTRATVEIIARNLKAQKIPAELIHGKLTQNRRLKVIEGFNKGKKEILVASAVAARGLHIDGVTHVFNYDLSNDPEEYIHRVGRTARAGQTGKAITLLSQKDYEAFDAINQRFSITVTKMEQGNIPRLHFQARGDSFNGRGRTNGRNSRFGDRNNRFRGSNDRGHRNVPRRRDDAPTNRFHNPIRR